MTGITIAADSFCHASVADLPGPWGLPLLGSWLQLRRGGLHRQMEEWCTRYGTAYTFRIGRRRVLVVADSDVVQDILRKRPGPIRRLRAIRTTFAEMVSPGLFAAEGEEWRQFQKLTMPAFSPARLRQFAGTLDEVTARLARRWHGYALATGDVDLLPDLLCYTVDVVARFSFGHDLRAIENGGVREQLGEVLQALHRRTSSPFPYWRYVKGAADRALDAAVGQLKERMADMIQRARARLAAQPELAKNPRNVLEAFLTARDQEGAPLSEEAIFGNVFGILVAGEDTTAYALAWAIRDLIERPGIQERVQAEVDEVWRDLDGPGGFADLQRLEYTQAVVLESMRLKPTVPFLSLEASEDLRLGRMAVPRGTAILALTAHGARLDSNFTAPHEFHPERWLDGQRPAGWVHHPRTFMLFGDGARVCPGQHLAILEIKAALAMLCRHFTVSAPRNKRETSEEYAFILGPADLRVNLACRKPER